MKKAKAKKANKLQAQAEKTNIKRKTYIQT